MPRFFFHLRNDMSVDDEEGLELVDLNAARLRAVAFAVEMGAASILEHQKVNLHHSIEVADESKRVVLTVEFGEVITVES